MLLIMMAAFALVLIAQFFFLKKPNAQPPRQQAQTVQSPETSMRAAAATPEVAPSPGSTPVKAASAETETVVENDLYRIVLTNRGAQAKSWVLKKFKDDKGQPLDLVNPAWANLGLPLSLFTYDDALRNKINTAFYVGSSTGQVTAPGEITFEFSDGTVSVRKTLRFDNTYVVWLETVV